LIYLLSCEVRYHRRGYLNIPRVALKLDTYRDREEISRHECEKRIIQLQADHNEMIEGGETGNILKHTRKATTT